MRTRIQIAALYMVALPSVFRPRLSVCRWKLETVSESAARERLYIVLSKTGSRATRSPAEVLYPSYRDLTLGVFSCMPQDPSRCSDQRHHGSGAHEHFGDALFVGSEHRGAAVVALIEYWVAEQEKINDEYGDGVHCEVHEGSVRDGYHWKALPWQPGDPVIDAEAEAQRKLLRT